MQIKSTGDARGSAPGRRIARGAFAWVLGALLAVSGIATGTGVGIAPAQATDPQNATVTTLTGKIVNSAGQPVAGATLTASPNRGDSASAPPRTAKTGADGTFSLTNDLLDGFVLVVDAPAPYVSSVLDTTGKLAAGDSSKMRIFNGGGTTALGTLTLQTGVKVSGTATLSGYVAKTDGSATLTGAGATAGKYFGFPLGELKNGANAWSTYVVPGNYTFEGWVESRNVKVPGPNADKSFTVGASGLAGLNLTFAGSGIGLSGKVTDPDGRPAAGVMVNASNTSGNGNRFTKSDASGNWTLVDLPAGNYKLDLQNGGHGDFGFWKSGSATVVPDSANATVINATTAGLKTGFNVTMRRGAPNEPTGVSATAGDARATVSWQTPSDRNGVSIYQYTVTAYAGATAVKSVSTTGAKTATVTGLTNGTAYTFKVQAFTGYGASPLSAASAAVTPKAPPVPGVATRLSGGSRYETAANVSKASFTQTGGTVYLANGFGLPDALAAAPVAGHGKAPILLVEANAIPAATAAELKRLKPAKIVLLGGSGVISDAMIAKVKAASGASAVERWNGSDRYATAADVAKRAFPGTVDTVYIANGFGLPDALAAAPVAGIGNSPILLVSATAVPSATAMRLAALKPKKIVLLGGTGVVPKVLESKLASAAGSKPSIVRWAGSDRYSTTATVTTRAFGSGASTVYVANGFGLPDALAAAPVAAVQNAPILLVEAGAIPSSTVTALQTLKSKRKIDKIVVLGGSGVVSDAVLAQLRGYTG